MLYLLRSLAGLLMIGLLTALPAAAQMADPAASPTQPGAGAAPGPAAAVGAEEAPVSPANEAPPKMTLEELKAMTSLLGKAAKGGTPEPEPPQPTAEVIDLDAETVGELGAEGEGQEERADYPAIEHVEFWYSKKKGSSRVTREQMKSDDYELKKEAEIKEKWIPALTGILEGDSTVAEEQGIDPVKAPLMVQLDELTQARMQENPIYFEDVVERMAQWNFFYDQLALWNKFVQQSVLREKLSKEEKPSFDPATEKADLKIMYEALQNHAKELAAKQEALYASMAANIEKDRDGQMRYEEWLEGRKQAMLRFAENWAHQYDGSQVQLGDTLFFVRNVAERPADPEDDTLKDYLPANAVLVEVPKEKLVTPYDLINPDGTLKQPAGK
ncbi:MAG TPA: hypothetical protein VM492_11060 [Sumerlaeia bacterium]|nr:hypothetical protein [Sumerlaeia bacterium]